MSGPGRPRDGFTFHADQEAPAAGPGGTPCIKITLSAEISGEYVTPEAIATAARQLASQLAIRLGDVAAQTAKGGM